MSLYASLPSGSFKFQSDSINTEAGGTNYAVCEKPLNSNLILLIRIPDENEHDTAPLFKFQSDSINTDA